MEKPPKKIKKHSFRLRQGLSLAILGFLALGGYFFWHFANQKDKEIPKPADSITFKTLISKDSSQVSRIAVSTGKGNQYTLYQQDGRLHVEGQPEFIVDEDRQKAILSATAVITVENTVDIGSEAWTAHREDFGLAIPQVTVTITYDGNEQAVLSIGDQSPFSSEYYFTLEGDPHLYLVSAGILDLYLMDLGTYHVITQPILHQQRIDQITLWNESGSVLASWELEGDITNKYASSAWRMTAPYHYPCDPEEISSLTSAIAAIHLGSFAGQATEANLPLYGLDTPRLILTVHQAAGDIASIGALGIYETTSYPESTFTMKVGNKLNDYIEYCQVDDTIYLVSNLSFPLLSGINAENALLYQPAKVPIENLASLTVEEGRVKDAYILRHEERVLENNDLATDENGDVILDTFVSKSGEDLPYVSFEAALKALQEVTVSGRLPEGFKTEETAAYAITLAMADGRIRTIECVPYDAVYDALRVDGTTLFYLTKGALKEAFLMETPQ